ncbi:acyl-CoA dehydrogenase family protein [Aeromicrobium ginsengisoli]|uniref:Acyl-CoA dehydrogenase n=1 Tax=Aeromicrobium ginsengisoli TaxID=363867 RepID=A0A5M4F9H6_9ACTN|nr:acyl-CoA dehydrogenase family protein [Aeromicrobium ginsengisoli]KAA1394296.1 acyl-CoA dehydrogenase [Aeromicrobium ginsengisoli]
MTATLHESEEDVALRRTVADIAERCRSTRAAEVDDHTSCWGALVRSGLTELRGADDDGAPLATVGQVVIVVEEMARAVCGAPLVGTLLATELQRLADVDHVVPDEALTVLLDQELRGLAADDALAWDAGVPVTHAVGLDGENLVVRALEGATGSQDLSRPVAVPAGDAELVGGTLDADARTAFEAFAHVVLAADLLGASGAVLESAIEYAGQRVQFGQPIGTFQAVQHLCARAHVQVEAQRSAVLFAAWSLDSGQGDVVPAIVAKAYGASAAVEVVEKAVQVFGGVAITWEFPAHRHLRRVLLDAEVLGNGSALSGHLFDVVEGRSDGLQ